MQQYYKQIKLIVDLINLGDIVMSKRHLRRCFISAPVEFKTQPLLSLLRKKGISAFDAYTLGYNNLVSTIEDKITKSDFLIAVITPKLNANVFYEIGLARGANKPIFLIVQGKMSVPSFLMDTVYVKSSLDDDLQVIAFYLDHFISEKEKLGKISKRKKMPRSQKLIDTKTPFEERLRDIVERGTGNDFLQFVKDFFEHQGALVEVAHGMAEKAADMSIWIDRLDLVLGNPILVELKFGHLTERDLKNAEFQMKEYLLKSNVRTGLVIYLDRYGTTFHPSIVAEPFVMRLDIRDLINKSVDQSIDQIVYQERNKIAHQS